MHVTRRLKNEIKLCIWILEYVAAAAAAPERYFLRIVDDKVGFLVHVRDEESEYDVDSEEAVDYVVHDKRRPRQVPQERELQRAYPRRVHH